MDPSGPARQPRRPDGRREPIGLDGVVRRAIALADSEGLAALSMRRLATALGIEPMSLYYYVRNKDDLLAAMLNAVLLDVPPPPATDDWRADMRVTALAFRDVLLAHPWATGLLMAPGTPSVERARWMDAVLGRLRAAGFGPELTHHAYHALDSHIVGFVLWVLPALGLQDRPDLIERFVREVPIAELPHLAEHMAQHQQDRPGDTSEFEFGLDLILDGLERLRTR